MKNEHPDLTEPLFLKAYKLRKLTSKTHAEKLLDPAQTTVEKMRAAFIRILMLDLSIDTIVMRMPDSESLQKMMDLAGESEDQPEPEDMLQDEESEQSEVICFADFLCKKNQKAQRLMQMLTEPETVLAIRKMTENDSSEAA